MKFIRKKVLASFVITVLVSFISYVQSGKITGKIIDKNSNSLSGEIYEPGRNFTAYVKYRF